MLPSLYEIYIYVHPRTVSNLYAQRNYSIVLFCGDPFMLDLVMVALGTGFFAVSILYTITCNHL